MLVVSALVMSSVPAAALDRSDGDFWEYDVVMSLDLTGFGLLEFELTGTMTHTFEETDEVTVNGTEYDVNVIDIEGVVGGSIDIMGIPTNLTIALSGYTSETDDGIATVADDVVMDVDATAFGIPLVSFIMGTSGTYSPPFLSGFKPGDTGKGDSWEEVVTETITSKMWNNSISETPWLDMTVEDTITYEVSVASERDEVETEAGTFNCLKMTVTADGGDYEIYWVSEKVGYIVKKETWPQGASEPSETITLTDYEWTNTAMMMYIYVAIGIVVVVVAAVVLVVLMRRKKAKPAVASPPAQQT
jgi:hypothetical protein